MSDEEEQKLDGHKLHNYFAILFELEMQMEIDRMKRSGEIPRIAMPIMKDGKRVGKAFIASTVEDMEKDSESIKKLWNETPYKLL